MSVMPWLLVLLGLALALLAGCGGGAAIPSSSNAFFGITPGATVIDTSCTGCNSTGMHGSSVHQFTATLNSGGPAAVTWSVSGGDASAGPGTITSSGQYSPPTYLSADQVRVVVTAALKSAPGIRATSVLTITPGFLQPLTPENVALGPDAVVNISGALAETGGGATIRFALSDTPNGTGGGQGSLSAPVCQRSAKAFTSCTVTYTAPAIVPAAGVVYVVASAGESPARTEAALLLNAAGVVSNPIGHQGQLPAPMPLGSSGGNNADFDLSGNTIVDCCSGTLGALLQNGNGQQYLLSNNHVLARSDHAAAGEAIVQPGLIDNNCTPNGDGPGTVPVASLTAWLPLHSPQTNVDAAIAQVASHTVDPTGAILELGTRQADGTLSAAPPGISSTGGKGEAAMLQMRVAKSGRTTGLTCGGISAIDVDVAVDYYRDCAETRPYLTKNFTNQLAVSGNRFSDAGDSGALLVDANNSEPVGLYFAGGTDDSGVVQGVANPVDDVLSELSTQSTSGTSYTFVGTADHPASCLSFGDSSVAVALSQPLSGAEVSRVQQALALARSLVNPLAGILGIAMGKSSDRAGEAAVILYVDATAQPAVPQTIGGVRTLVIPTTAHAVAFGAAPMANSLAGAQELAPSSINQAVSIKHQIARRLLEQNPAFFGVGVGQSLDNPREAALAIYVDRSQLPANLPPTISGLRTRYTVMDKFHVTRSYAAPFEAQRHCMPHAAAGNDPRSVIRTRSLHLF